MLAIDWANVGIKAAQLILSLSLLVIVHEFGHFLPAKFISVVWRKYCQSLRRLRTGDTDPQEFLIGEIAVHRQHGKNNGQERSKGRLPRPRKATM